MLPAFLLAGLVVAGMGGRPHSTAVGRADRGLTKDSSERRIQEQRARTARGVTLAEHEIGYIPSVFGYLGSTTEKVGVHVGPDRNGGPNAAGPSIRAVQSTAEFGEKTTSAAAYEDGPIGYIVVTVIQAEGPQKPRLWPPLSGVGRHPRVRIPPHLRRSLGGRECPLPTVTGGQWTS